MSVQPDRPVVVPLHPVTEAPIEGMPRRAALQALLSGAAAAFGVPAAIEAQHPIQQHLANPAAIEQAQQRAAATPATPVFLDEHQSKTLEVLAEAIVPGSTGARVGPFIDQLLQVDSAANQRAFLGALGAFDMAAISRHGRFWTAITPQQQDVLLREASTADAKTSALRGHFQNLKDWIAGAYYSSEIGMRELGWDGNVVHAELPGCTHPGGHQE
jgi:gluconate 2-dehydrogenase subunit 3-like protein